MSHRVKIAFLFYLLFGLLFFNLNSYGQNLVFNASFEDTIACPANFAEIEKANGWINVSNLSGLALRGSPDYFNSCSHSINPSMSVPKNWAGYQKAKSGEAYAGIITLLSNYNSNYSELIGSRLISNLIPNNKYYISMYVSMGDADSATGGISSNNIGVLFSMDTLNIWDLTNSTHINEGTIIEDSIGWTFIHGSFVSKSSYSFISIGNFYADSLTNSNNFTSPAYTAYYYIDDVCVSSDPTDCNITVGIQKEHNSTKPHLIKVTDMKGQVIINPSQIQNQLLLYHYNDGSVRKMLQLE